MLTVWGRTNSSNVMKVLWLLEELGLAYQRIDAGLAFGRTDTPGYRAMNPLGLVPTLQDGDYSLFESNAIMRYLCAAHAPGTPFYPADARVRGTVEAWTDFQQTALTPVQSPVFQAVVRTPPERRDAATIAASVAAAARIWSVLDTALGQRAWVAGEALTIADVAFGPHVHRWFAMPIDRPDFLNLRGYYDRLLARPAYLRICAVPPS
jgi:glutathione S-transferase